jgi:putative transposase
LAHDDPGIRAADEIRSAQLLGAGGKTREWKSKVLRTYQRRRLAADALIASAYLAGTNTRRVRRALKALFAEGIAARTSSAGSGGR